MLRIRVLKLLAEVSIELGALFLSEPHTGFTNGLPEKKRKPEPVDHWREAVKALNEAIAEARHNCETARSLFTLASYGRRDPESLDRLRDTFAQEGIPPEFLSHYVPREPFALVYSSLIDLAHSLTMAPSFLYLLDVLHG